MLDWTVGKTTLNCVLRSQEGLKAVKSPQRVGSPAVKV